MAQRLLELCILLLEADAGAPTHLCLIGSVWRIQVILRVVPALDGIPPVCLVQLAGRPSAGWLPPAKSASSRGATGLPFTEPAGMDCHHICLCTKRHCDEALPRHSTCSVNHLRWPPQTVF